MWQRFKKLTLVFLGFSLLTTLAATIFFFTTDTEHKADYYARQAVDSAAKHQWDIAHGYLIDAMAINKKLQRKEALAKNHGMLGMLYYNRALTELNSSHTLSNTITDYLAHAEKYFKEALSRHQLLDDKIAQTEYQRLLAALYIVQKNYDEAEYYTLKMITLLTTLKRHRGIVSSYLSLGSIYNSLKHADEACDAWIKGTDFYQNNQISTYPEIKQAIEQDYNDINVLITKNGCTL